MPVCRSEAETDHRHTPGLPAEEGVERPLHLGEYRLPVLLHLGDVSVCGLDGVEDETVE